MRTAAPGACDGFIEEIPTRQLLGSVLRALDERPRPAIVLQVMETLLPGGKTDRAWGGLFAKYTGPMPMGTTRLSTEPPPVGLLLAA